MEAYSMGSSRGGTGSKIGSGVGMGAGAVFGGPMGAAVGASAGGMIGGLFDDDVQGRQMRDLMSELSGVQRPGDISYSGIADEAGNLKQNFQLEDAKNWIQKAMEQQAAEEAALGNKATSQSLGAQAQAAQTLGSKGGMRGGAAERIAKSGSRDLMQALQDVNMQGIQTRALTGLKGEEMNRDTSKFNIGNRITDQQAREKFKQEKYAADMQAWAAAQQARQSLMASGGGGGGGGGGKK